MHSTAAMWRHLDFFFFGTFAPDFRASERPIAMACLRLVTFLPERPLFSVPRFRLCIARLTFLDAFLLNFLGMATPLARPYRFSAPAAAQNNSQTFRTMASKQQVFGPITNAYLADVYA